jgi:hypothetical protein
VDEYEAGEGPIGNAATSECLLVTDAVDDRLRIDHEGVMAVLADNRGMFVDWAPYRE